MLLRLSRIPISVMGAQAAEVAAFLLVVLQ